MGPDPEAKRENTASGRAGPPAGAPVRVPRRAWWDHPWRAVGGLCVLVCVSRLPFRTPMLTSWDAAQFALAMEDFDVARHRPHPPGYLPLVAAARAIDLLVHDANASLVLVAIVFSMLGVIAVYGLGRAMFDGRVGVTAALLYAISPLHWALGEVALPYTAEGALCAAVAWLLWHSRQGCG
ncbi:MAG TPA: glycosyltransferase family 39 protein, partial [Armatimonadota bacterium]|nr:glycosyltransferase family 39 protein [Armatimonadota bacterium]